jgi:hypothetical protein
VQYTLIVAVQWNFHLLHPAKQTAADKSLCKWFQQFQDGGYILKGICRSSILKVNTENIDKVFLEALKFLQWA